MHLNDTAPQEAEGSALSFLVLDDDPAIRRGWARAAASRADVALTIVATAEEARAALALDPHAFDLVVCDYRLGGAATSAELVRVLQRVGAQVIVVSGDVHDARLDVSLAGVRLLGKPVRIDDLIAVIASSGVDRTLSPRLPLR